MAPSPLPETASVPITGNGHAAGDDLVPVSQSTGYVAAATAAGDDSRLVRVNGGHFGHLDPASSAVAALRAALAGSS